MINQRDQEENEEMLQQLNEFAKAAKLAIRQKAAKELDDYVKELLK